MYFITAFGLLLMFLSIIMIVHPDYWSNGIITFSEKPYFHYFEVISRFISGFVFVLFNESTRFPQFILIMGYLFIGVSFVLFIMGSIKHRKFAVWSAHKFKSAFRSAGTVSLIFSLFLIYVSTISMFSY
jgi:hypothetical protein